MTANYPTGAVGDLLRSCEAAGAKISRPSASYYLIDAPGGRVLVRRAMSAWRLQQTRERLRTRGIRFDEEV